MTLKEEIEIFVDQVLQFVDVGPHVTRDAFIETTRNPSLNALYQGLINKYSKYAVNPAIAKEIKKHFNLVNAVCHKVDDIQILTSYTEFQPISL